MPRETINNALERIGVTKRHWDYMLRADRNASVKLARVIERETGIAKEIFVFGSEATRRSEWSKALERMNKLTKGEE